jgi:hypothetical protein
LNRFYRQVESLEFDVNQILSNCDMYNQEGADISVTAAELIGKIHSIIRNNVGTSFSSSSTSMEQPSSLSSSSSSSSSFSSSNPALSGLSGSGLFNPDLLSGTYPDHLSGSYLDSCGLSSNYPGIGESADDNEEHELRLSNVRQREIEVPVESNKRIRFSLSDKETDDDNGGLRLVINRGAKVASSSSSGNDENGGSRRSTRMPYYDGDDGEDDASKVRTSRQPSSRSFSFIVDFVCIFKLVLMFVTFGVTNLCIYYDRL